MPCESWDSIINQNHISEVSKAKYENSLLSLKLENSARECVKIETKLKETEEELNNVKAKNRLLEAEISTLKKFASVGKSGPQIEIVKENPYASGVSFKITPGLKKPIEHTDRSLLLLKHLKSCPIMTRIAVERLLGCSRKAATGLLKKLWIGGYLDSVTCIGLSDRFEVYYIPTLQSPRTANQVCQMAMLSLFYAALNIDSSITVLSFTAKRSEMEMAKEIYRNGGIGEYYSADVDFVYDTIKDGENQKNQHSIVVFPIRHEDKSIFQGIYDTHKRIVCIIPDLKIVETQINKIRIKNVKNSFCILDSELIKGNFLSSCERIK